MAALTVVEERGQRAGALNPRLDIGPMSLGLLDYRTHVTGVTRISNQCHFDFLIIGPMSIAYWTNTTGISEILAPCR